MYRRTVLSSVTVLSVGVSTAGCLSTPFAPKPSAAPVFQAGTEGASSVGNDALREWLDPTDVGELTPTERDDVFWMREEEKLARDVYITLADEWGLESALGRLKVGCRIERKDLTSATSDPTCSPSEFGSLFAAERNRSLPHGTGSVSILR